MKKAERYRAVLDYFRKETGNVTTELEFGSTFQLLVAVVLSAQCTDKRINQVTPALFQRFPDARVMAAADEPQRQLSQRQGQPPGGDGPAVGGASRRRGAQRHERAVGSPRRRPQDGERHSGCRLRTRHNGCRYSCIPRQPPARTSTKDC